MQEFLTSKEFWTTVTTGALSLIAALLGAWLANRNSLQLIRTQLEHDARERAREREMVMVGTDATVHAIIPLMAEYTAVVSDLIGRRADLIVLKNLVDSLPEENKSPIGPFRQWHPYLQQLVAQEMALAKALILGTGRITERLPPALFAVREELGLPLTRQAYLSIIEDTRRGQVEVFEERIRELEKQMAED